MRTYCPYFTDEKTEAQGGQRLPQLWKQQSGELEPALMAGLGQGEGQLLTRGAAVGGQRQARS